MGHHNNKRNTAVRFILRRAFRRCRFWTSEPAAVYYIMHDGTILSVRIDKGFGFIGEPNSPDLFFHVNDCIDLEWTEHLKGQRVQFEVISTPKGMKARNVRAAF